ncbi:MAG: FAD:protein FMN transferase [Clostridiales bacterium]|nr:FAD:protein FMN transferase [Clostridiales bacterium]
MSRKVVWIGCAVIALSIVLYLAGFAPESREEPEDYGGFRSGITYAMNTVIEQKWYGESADTVYTGMETKIREIESVLSMHLSQSEIAAINENAGVQPVEVSQRTFDLLQRAKELSEQSDGAFDITIAPVVELWGITSDHPHVPTDEELAQAMALMGLEDLVLDEEACTAYLTRPGMAIDLGGIAKGWTADQLREYARELGAERGYVSLGGNLMIIGERPDGDPFKFGLRDPQGDASTYLGTVTLEDGCTMATTGGYERYFEEDGIRYHHVLDPRTGYPADSDLLSVAVISKDGTLADYLSTTLFVQGLEAAKAAAGSEDYALVMVDQENNVWISGSLRGNFEPHETDADYTYIYID